MTLLYIIGGLTVGLLLFLMIRRKVNKAEKRAKYDGLKVFCPTCNNYMDVSYAYVRSGLRGDFCKCSWCGNTSIWDLDRRPPVLRRE